MARSGGHAVEEAEKLAEDCMSSALARAHEHGSESGLPPAEVFAAVITMRRSQ